MFSRYTGKQKYFRIMEKNSFKQSKDNNEIIFIFIPWNIYQQLERSVRAFSLKIIKRVNIEI